MKTETDIGVMPPRVREYLGLPEAGRDKDPLEAGRDKDPPLRALEGTWLYICLDFGFLASRTFVE